MAQRSVHLVGSIPGDSAEAAMRWALERFGSRLRYLPDGETGDRNSWIVHIVESFRRHPDLRLRKDGKYSTYGDQPQFGLRSGHRLRAEALDFGYVASAAESYPLFRRLRQEYDQPGLAFQVGVASDLALVLFTLGPLAALRLRQVFAERLAAEISQIQQAAGSDVLFQVELPGELILVSQLPGPLRAAVARRLAAGVARLAARVPAGTRFGIHLCLGDLRNRAAGSLGVDAGAAVTLANAVGAAWPADRPLEFVHLPLAAGNVPPVLRAEYYQPLRRLALPSATRLVAGLVHEAQSLADQRRVLDWVEAGVGHQVDLASACGLGRRSLVAAEQLAEQTVALGDG